VYTVYGTSFMNDVCGMKVKRQDEEKKIKIAFLNLHGSWVIYL